MKGGKFMVFKSDHDVNTLKERWDDKTAFKNFAGGDDYTPATIRRCAADTAASSA